MKHFRAQVLALLVPLLLLPALALADGTIDSVSVKLTSTEAVPPDAVARRIENSISTVSQQVLLGRKISEVADRRTYYENIIKEVFDRVLVGYSVQQVNIVPDSNAAVTVVISPWGDVVCDVKLNVELGGISPELAGLIKGDMGNMEDQFRQVLVGLPIDAVDWAGSVSKSVMRELLASELPEFSSTIEIVPEAHTVVKLNLIPRGPIIQDTTVALSSNTIPNILLLEARKPVAEATAALRGLPVAFVERHRDYFETELKQRLAAQAVAKKYALTIIPVLEPATDTKLTLIADTAKYKVSLEGYLDMGRKADTTSLKLHAGKFISAHDEAFIEITFVPSSVSWDFAPGWGRELSSKTAAGVKYHLDDNKHALWFNQQLGHNWTLRVERSPADEFSELGVRYKLHEFLSAEYVFTPHENWLRLVGRL